MRDFFLTKILRYIGRKLDGYKTKIGGGGLILLGIVHLIAEIFPDVDLPKASIEQALIEITGGFSVLGIGGKMQKQTDAIADK